jgi:hypothetical protein
MDGMRTLSSAPAAAPPPTERPPEMPSAVVMPVVVPAVMPLARPMEVAVPPSAAAGAPADIVSVPAIAPLVIAPPATAPVAIATPLARAAALLAEAVAAPDRSEPWDALRNLVEQDAGPGWPTPDDIARIAPSRQPEAALCRARLLLAMGQRLAATALLRSLPGMAEDRPALVHWSHRAGSHDPDFLGHIATADRRRDQLSWAEAEFHYFAGLQLYPAHSGYMTQCAHCLKEQDKLLDAEVYYRSALALGEAPDDLAEHIGFVCARQGLQMGPWSPPGAPPAARPGAAAPVGLDLVPTRQDVERLFELMLGRPAASLEEIAIMLRSCPTCADVVALLLEHREFRVVHRNLLEILAG